MLVLSCMLTFLCIWLHHLSGGGDAVSAGYTCLLYGKLHALVGCISLNESSEHGHE